MNSLSIQTNLTYCPQTLAVNQPLTISNTSQQQLAFKIKTNQKNLLSMYINHGFIKPFSTLSIPVKIVQKFEENVQIKLQINWAKVTPEMKQKNDTKMATVPKDLIFKKIFSISRQSLSGKQRLNTSAISEQKSSMYESVYDAIKDQRKVSPFQYEKSLDEDNRQNISSPKKQIQNSSHKHVQNSPKKCFDMRQVVQQPEIKQQKSNILNVPLKNLQVVSEQDEQDPQKELQQIRNQQVQQKRKIDELKVKLKKANQQIKSSQIIDPKLLFVLLASSYLVGSFTQYLFFDS